MSIIQYAVSIFLLVVIYQKTFTLIHKSKCLQSLQHVAISEIINQLNDQNNSLHTIKNFSMIIDCNSFIQKTKFGMKIKGAIHQTINFHLDSKLTYGQKK